MEDFLNSSFGKLLRWIFLLPLSFLVLYIVPYIWNFFMFISNTEVGGHETWLMYFFRTLISGGIASFAFVFVGSIIAPIYRKIVSIVLCTIIITLYIFLISGLIKYELFWGNSNVEGILNILFYIFSFAGAIGAVVSVWEDD